MSLIASWAQRLRQSEAASARVQHNSERLSDTKTLLRSREAAMQQTSQELQDIDQKLITLDLDSQDPHRGLQILQTAIEESARAHSLEQGLEPGWEEKLERYKKRKAEGKPVD